jgi:uncharacterized membrane protein
VNILIIILRAIHVLAGVFWAGSTFFMVSLLDPAIRAIGAEGAKVMQDLSQQRRLSPVLGVAGWLTVGTGLWMYIVDFGWFSLSSGYAASLTFGGLCGLVAVAIGSFVSGRASMRMAALGKEMQAAGGPPTPAQITEMGALRAKLSSGARPTAILLTLSVLSMAVARYLTL